MSVDNHSLCEIIAYITVYTTWPFIAGGGAAAAGGVIAGYRTLRDVVMHHNYRHEVRGEKKNRTVVWRHIPAWELYKDHFYKDLGIDKKHEI